MESTYLAIPIFTTARTAAFIPEQSPPLVKIASFVGRRCDPAFPLVGELADDDPVLLTIFRDDWTEGNCDRLNSEGNRPTSLKSLFELQLARTRSDGSIEAIAARKLRNVTE